MQTESSPGQSPARPPAPSADPGHPPDPAALALAEARRHAGPSALLQVLRTVQQACGCVPEPAVAALAGHWGLTLAAVRGVVGFYHFLSPEPRGEFTVYVSDAPTDRLLGNQAAIDALCRGLGVEERHTRADGRVSVHRTACTGLCDQGPAALVNGWPLTRLSPQRAALVARLIDAGTPLARWPAEFFAVTNAVWRRDRTLHHPLPPGSAIRAALALGPDALLQTLLDAGLRGRGGAGFMTAQKWQACRAAPGPRAITCNADEGEPGTFKDRMLLMEWADEVIEGMTVAALTVGADQGFIYLRGEYAFIEPHLREVLARRESAGWLGADVAGSGQPFHVQLHLGAGAYVCGEETALIESLEGQRGIPRSRPPFPVEHGYLGRPTVNNNVETFVQAAQIALHGVAWFASCGTEASRGTRILSVAGDVARPGFYEVPWGTTVAQVLADCGAEAAQAVLVGGPSGRLLGATQAASRRLAFEDLPTGGAFTVFGPGRDLVDIARQYTRFFASESCGFCTPCRVGCGQLQDTAERLARGHASPHELARLRHTATLMQQASHCGLGQTAAHPLLDLLEQFPAAVQARLGSPLNAFDLEAAVAHPAEAAVPHPEITP